MVISGSIVIGFVGTGGAGNGGSVGSTSASRTEEFAERFGSRKCEAIVSLFAIVNRTSTREYMSRYEPVNAFPAKRGMDPNVGTDKH